MSPGLQRKRTNSFSFSADPDAAPRPTKSLRMSPLKRTQSLLFLPTPDPATSPSPPCYSTLAYYKEQRQRRKQHNPDQLTIRIHTPKRLPPSFPPKPKATPPLPPSPSPSRGRTRTPTAPSKVILPSVASPVTTVLTPRTSSPLSPKRVPLPGRPVFPRSKKPEPDLYRMAIRMRMLLSPEGQKILSLGPRVAMEMQVGMEMHMQVERVNGVKEEAERTRRDIVSVTRDLEKMVEDICDDDILMDCFPTTTTTTTTPTTTPPQPAPAPPQPIPAPPILTTSWVLVKGEDWEMVDCTA